jgi:predicted HAD superfamily phosphohydrolase YqeG
VNSNGDNFEMFGEKKTIIMVADYILTDVLPFLLQSLFSPTIVPTKKKIKKSSNIKLEHSQFCRQSQKKL